MKRVMVTGAAGFMGRALSAHLAADGVEVVGIDRLGDPAANIIAGDISEPGDWQRAAAGCDALIHTAALVAMPTDTSAFWAVNVRGTRLAVEAARDHGVKRLVHVSSVVTFGLDFPDGVDERYPVHPTGVAYVDTKIASEQVVLMAHAAGELQATIVRPGDIYGPASRPWVLLPLQEMRANRFALPAMGRGIHSPVYIDDVVEGIVRAASDPRAAGRVITLSGGKGVTTRDYFGRLAELAELRKPLPLPTAVALSAAVAIDRIARVRGRQNDLTPDAVHYLADRRGTYGIATAKALLDWSPQVDLDEGMARTGVWLEEQGGLAG